MFRFSLPRQERSPCDWAIWLLALSVVSTPVRSAPVELTFDQAVRAAVAEAPLLAARHAQTTAAREEATRAAALPDPRLTVGIANWPVTGADAFDFRADDMTMKQIGVMQEIPARAKRLARGALAERTAEQAEALSIVERLSVRQATAQAWIVLWAAHRELAVLKTLHEPSAVAARTAKARLAGGTGSASEALATRAALLELENRIDVAETQVQALRAGLGRWVGDASADVAITGEPPDLTVLPIDEATLFASIDRHGPVRPWRSREAVAEAEVAAAIADKRPDWSVGVSYGQRERSPVGMRRSDMLMVEFAVDLPLFPRNRQDRGIAARRADLEAAAAEREDARRMQAETVQRRLAEWRGLKRQVARIETESLPLARDRGRTALAAYAGGADLQPWLDARRDEIELHIEHTRRLAELGRAWTALAYLLPEEEASP